MDKKPKKVKYNIICLSNQLWGFPNWTNKRHVMSRLAKDGHRIVFVDPSLNVGRLFMRQLFKGMWTLKKFVTKSYKDSTGATIFTPLNVLPIQKLNSYFHVMKIKKLAKANFKKGYKTVLWVYHVQIAGIENYLKGLNYDVLIYDCVDNYEAFPESSSLFPTSVSKEVLQVQEKLLTESSDVVFASAPGLLDKLKKYNKNVFYTPNVGDYKRFKNTKSYKYKTPKEFADISRPRIGMIGAMDEYKFDAELIRKCAADHPEYSFVMIGPLALKDKNATIEDLNLAGIDNVHYLGSVPYEEKKHYMAGFDVDIIPYQLNDYTVGGVFPVKFHDSLAAGLPVVVTNLPAYAPFEDVCYISKDYDEFSSNIALALDEDNETRVKQRQVVAKENDWDHKVAKMLSHVDALNV